MKKNIDELGRILIPKIIRKQLDVSIGEELNLEVKDEKIIISKIHDEFEEYLKSLYEEMADDSVYQKLVKNIYLKYAELKK